MEIGKFPRSRVLKMFVLVRAITYAALFIGFVRDGAVPPLRPAEGTAIAPQLFLARSSILLGKLKFRGGHILFEMGERRCSRDWQYNRRFLQQPRQRELHGADVTTFRFGFERIARLGQ